MIKTLNDRDAEIMSKRLRATEMQRFWETGSLQSHAEQVREFAEKFGVSRAEAEQNYEQWNTPSSYQPSKGHKFTLDNWHNADNGRKFLNTLLLSLDATKAEKKAITELASGANLNRLMGADVTYAERVEFVRGICATVQTRIQMQEATNAR